MLRFVIASLILVGVPGISANASAPADTVPVGIARVDITPDYPVRLSGFGFRRKESEGISQHIWAKALAIGDDKSGPVVVITVDNLGIPDAMRREVARRLHKKVGLQQERLAITASHTHTAPMLTQVAPTLFGQPIPKEHQKHIDRYTRELTDRLEQAALAAFKDRKPARLAWTIGKVTFARNRRTRGGPVDHDLPLLVVKDTKGMIRAIYVTYACHCVTLSNNKISGDWAGYAQDIIERMHPGAVALVSIGCGADSNPDSGVTGDKVDIARAQGAQIADEIKRLLKTKLKPLTGKITAKFQRISLDFDTLPTRKEWEQRAKRKGAVGYHARVQLARLDRGEKLQTKLDYPIQTWSFGDQLAMVFLPGEVVVDYALRLKRELDRKRLWINAYANDSPCYIPSERILKEGGYEGGGAMIYYDRPTRLKPGIENRIVREVHRQLDNQFKAPAKKESGALAPKESLQRIRTGGDMVVELVAAEPLVVDPVAIDFGPDGRLWVAEMHDYPLGIDGKYKPGGRVKVLEDTDGDGKFDKATVFLDGLAFPTGVTIWRKGVLVCTAPDVLYAEDTDGDGKADKVRKLLTGFATHNYQARVNSLRYGLDNWVYGSSGLFGGKIKGFTGKVVSLNRRDFRFKPDTGEIEPVSGISQQGRVRDDWGNWFGCNNSVLLFHYPLTDRYIARNRHIAPPSPNVPVPANADGSRLFPASDSLQLFKLSGPPGRVTAACGLGIYRDVLLGAPFTGNAFTCEPVNLIVHRLVLSPRGVTFTGRRAAGEEKAEFLSSTDRWFRPVQARTGPDGALWVVDMYRHVIEHPRWIPPETLAKLDVRAGCDRGRIYRIYPRGKKLRPLLNLSKLDTANLVAALDCPNGTQRDLVQQMILWQKDKAAVAPLRKLAQRSKRPTTRLQAMCTLDGLSALTPELLIAALADKHAGVRRHAVRLSESRLGDSPQLAKAFLKLLGDTDPQVTMQLAYSLGEWKDPRTAQALAELAVQHQGDAYLLSAVLSSVHDGNIETVLSKLLRDGAKTAAQKKATRQLLHLAGSLGNRKVLAKVADLITRPEKQESPAWQMDMLSHLLEAADQRKQSLQTRLPLDEQKRMDKLIALARAAAMNEKADASLRLAAIRLLGSQTKDRDRDIKTLAGLLAPRHAIPLQRAAAAALDKLHAASEILRRWHSLTPAVRGEVLDLLLSRESSTLALLSSVEAKKIKAIHFDAARREQLLRHKNTKIRRLADKLLGSVSKNRTGILQAYRAALAMKGNVARGQKVFTKSCAACHRIGEVGHAIGPDLAALTDRAPKNLLVAILDPNRDVEERYLTYLAANKNGQTFTGILAAETGSSIVLRNAEGKEHVLLRSELDILSSTGVSLMPEGLEKDLSKQDVGDLLSYLATLERRKIFAGNEPAVITLDKDGTLHLPATRCAIYGKEICFEQPLQNIGFWHDENDHVVWQVRLKKAGRYDVVLDYACHPDSAGNTFLLDSEPPLRGQVASTGGWDRYQQKRIGTITLQVGVNTLTLRPDGKMKRRALMDLRGLHLTPGVR